MTMSPGSGAIEYRSRTLAQCETRKAVEGGQIAVDAPATLPSDQWQLWHTLAPRLQAAGTLHAGTVRAYRNFISSAAVLEVLSRHKLALAPTFRVDVIRQAARFGLTAADVDQLMIVPPCAKGIQ